MTAAEQSGDIHFRGVVLNGNNFFVQLVEKKASVTVELKNDLSVQGTITHVDQFLNIKLDDIRVSDAQKHPHLVRKLV